MAEHFANKIIIPMVKKQEIICGELLLERIYCNENIEDYIFAKTYLNLFLIDIDSTVQSDSNLFLKRSMNIKEGGYKLSIDNCVSIIYNDLEGLRNALSTFIQILVVRDNKFLLQKQIIEDYSDCKYRSIMIDLARGLPDFERLVEDVKRLALAKCNKLHLHLMDMQGICYESDCFKCEEIRGTKPYTKEQLKRLVDLCKELCIEIVPEIEYPAHATKLLEVKPELRCKVNKENESLWTVCMGSQDVLNFYYKLIKEVCEIFPSKYLHIGGDEHAFPDRPDLNRAFYWNECPICKKKMQEIGADNTTELFYYQISKLQEFIESLGRTVILWNDEIDISKIPNVSKDCIIQFWRIAHEGRGPRKDCSYLKFLEKGYNVIVSPYQYCYLNSENYINPEKIAGFDFKSYDKGNDYSKQILGMEGCAWEYGNPNYTHYPLSFASSAILTLAKCWDNSNVTYDKKYRIALTKVILGNYISDSYDLFEIFGSIIPPRKNDLKTYATLDNELISKEELIYHKKILSDVEKSYSKQYLNNLLKVINV